MTVTSPVFFVSYARSDFDNPKFRQYLTTFITDVEAQVAQDLGVPPKDVAFVEVDGLHAGELWSPELAAALQRCQVGLPLYSTSYFTREWCGKECQVFLDRSGHGTGPTGIVPVRWGNKIPPLPLRLANIQYTDQTFPPEYAQLGMQKLMELADAYPGKYQLAVHALANRIVDTVTNGPLQPNAAVDFEKIGSAWNAAAGCDPDSHTKGGISKTCFVYVSRQGWEWGPYDGVPASVGAMAQRISGELGVRYEEIPCDAGLSAKLKAANDNDVPTILLGDPDSFSDEKFASPMRQYDTQYLLNCATLMAWHGSARDSLDTDPKWKHLKTICKQKANDPPPHDDWRAIFSRTELDAKIRVSIETIRSRLMKRHMAEKPVAGEHAVRKAVDAAATANAASQGISTSSLAQLANSVQ